MAQTEYSFARYEKKYLLTMQQYEYLRERLTEKMEEDCYGLHTICNIYCDTPNYELIRRSLKKPPYKEKFRFRSYGVPAEEDRIFAEIKKKYAGVVYKRRIEIEPMQTEQILLGEVIQPGQIGREIAWFMQKYRPDPRVFIGYERVALAGKKDPALRITFDRNLRFRQDQLALTLGDQGEALTRENQVIMEIKVPSAMPLWLAGLLSECRIYPGSFSKYGFCYQEHLAGQLLQSADLRMRTAG